MKQSANWLAAAVIIVGTFFTIYGVAQQILRQSANNALIVYAESDADSLNQGAQPSQLTSNTYKANLARVDAPFIIVYDKQGKTLSASAQLDGHALPVIPNGVLLASRGEAYHAVTWQPRDDLRFATVTVAAKDYYVVAGHSLAETEKTESHMLGLAAIGCACSLLVLGSAFWVSTSGNRRR